MKFLLPILVLLLSVAVGCGADDNNNKGPGACTEVSVDGTTYCAWEKSIIVETGYQCPEAYGFFHDFENVAVCSTESMPPTEEIIERIEREFGIGQNNENNLNNENNQNNNGCTVDSDCPAGQACSIGLCVTPCTTGADCADDEVCAPAIDGPVSSLCTTASCDSITAYYDQDVAAFQQDCTVDTDCQVIDGHCGVGIGGCYYTIGASDDASNLASLAATFTDQGCTNGVCDCAPPPRATCDTANSVCVSEPFVFSGDVTTDDGSMPDWTGANVHAIFEDVTIIDEAAIEISRTIVAGPTSLPVPFTLYAPEGFNINQANMYNLRVHVDVDADGSVTTGDWVTAQSYPVTSFFDVVNAEVELVP